MEVVIWPPFFFGLVVRAYVIRSDWRPSTNARLLARTRIAPGRTRQTVRPFGRFAQRLHLRYQRPLRQAQLPLPSARSTGAWSEPAIDLQGSGEDRHRVSPHTGRSEKGETRDRR